MENNLPPKVLKIARMGHPALRQRAREVTDPTSPIVRKVVDDMIETAKDFGSYSGLAAPQVHIPLRIILIHVPKERCDEMDPEGFPLTAMINLTIEPLTDKQHVGWEGCMSVPGMMGRVARFTHIALSYQALDGKMVSREAKGYLARVIQHECDHLDGILYPQRMTDFGKFGFMDEIVRYTMKPKKTAENTPITPH